MEPACIWLRENILCSFSHRAVTDERMELGVSNSVRGRVTNLAYLYNYVHSAEACCNKHDDCDLLSYIYTQGDSGGTCNTLGNDSMCDSKKKKNK